MGSLKDLANNMRKLAADLDKQANSAVVAIAECMLEELINSTPVDTSKALSNWQVSVGLGRILLSQALPPYVAGSAGSTRAESAAAALQAGRNVLQSKKPGDRLFISNVLPYIQRLNDGYSKQAPAGFVERAVLVGRKKAESGGGTLKLY